MAKWKGLGLGCNGRKFATTLADSYIHASASSAGSAAEMAASRKNAKYADLPASYIFQPIAFEMMGIMNMSSASNFLNDLGAGSEDRQ